MYQAPPRRRRDDDDDHVHDNPNQKVHEVWFAGNHGDVGGGWAPVRDKAPTTSYVPLVWMVRAAKAAGVKLSDQGLKQERIVLERTGAAAQSVDASHIASDAEALKLETEFYDVEHGIVLDDLHDCLRNGHDMKWWKSAGWNCLQFFPIKIMEYIDDAWKPTILRRKRHRTIPRHENTRIHASVFDRKQRDPTYDPPNLPGCNKLQPHQWWEHGPFRRRDDTGFCYADWEPALDEYSGTDYISLVYKMKEGLTTTASKK
jgi:hypothetical protein